MLMSFLNQSLQTPIFISISFDIIFEFHVDKIIEYYHKKHKTLIKFFKHNKQLSQFEHYSFLVNQFENILINHMWCLFTDDDDYLHPQRNSSYMKLIQLANKNKEEISVVNKTMLTTSWDNTTNVKALEFALKRGINRSRVLFANEYVCYCIRVSYFKKYCVFLDKHKKLDTYQCDIVLGAMLHNICTTFACSGETEWLFKFVFFNFFFNFC